MLVWKELLTVVDSPMQPLHSSQLISQHGYKQFKYGLVLLVITVVAGTAGFYLMGRGQWSVERCLYMTVITISTVGYSEVIPVSQISHGRIFVILLILFGMGSVVYFGSSIVALVIEKDISKYWREKKMLKEISKLRNHVIVCGAGTVGKQVIMELIVTRTPFVVIERDESKIDEIRKEFNFKNPLYVIGDATDDEVLMEAGIENARGIVVALPSDKDSLIVTVTARQISRDLRIVSRCHEPSVVQRIIKAGANSVVSPNIIGGMRLASEMIRPRVVEFLDLMLRDKDRNLRIEEAKIPDDSDLIGKRLQDTWIRKITSLLVIAVKDTVKGRYIYNPGPDFQIETGTTLILLGTSDDVYTFKKRLGVVDS